MLAHLHNQRVLLGVSGGIAAYKAPQLVRELQKMGATVRVAMTDNAAKLVSEAALQAVSGYPVATSLWETDSDFGMDHIALARWADVILIAPATANTLASCAQGNAQDLITTLILATNALVCFAPAMNQRMWQHPATQRNIQQLKAYGAHILGPDYGEQACGDIGPGRLREPTDLVNDLIELTNPTLPLQGEKWVLTAGPTREKIDPIRFLTNRSTGRMGYALANTLSQLGAEVILISGPVSLLPPSQLTTIEVESAEEMHAASTHAVKDAQVFMSVAAVADYTLASPSKQKIKKSGAPLTLELTRTQDIIQSVSEQFPHLTIIGFSAETENCLEQSRKKRQKKGMDWIVANTVGTKTGFDNTAPAVTLIGERTEISLCAKSKEELAPQLIEAIQKQRKIKASSIDALPTEE